MKNFFFNKKIERLEKAGNNDYELIIAFGADAYSTEELNTLLQKISVERDITNEWQAKAKILVITICFWLTAFFYASSIGYLFLGYAFLFAIPISIVFALVVYLFLYRQYPYINNFQQVISIIQDELDRRRHDKLIF